MHVIAQPFDSSQKPKLQTPLLLVWHEHMILAGLHLLLAIIELLPLHVKCHPRVNLLLLDLFPPTMQSQSQAALLIFSVVLMLGLDFVDLHSVTELLSWLCACHY